MRNSECKRCHKPLNGSTATVDGTEGYPAYMLRAGDPLCGDCDRNRAAAFRRPWTCNPTLIDANYERRAEREG